MGIANPTEAVVGILALIDEVKAKMEGTRLAELPWRPASPDCADEFSDLAGSALKRCDDVTEAVIVVTVAAMTLANAEWRGIYLDGMKRK